MCNHVKKKSVCVCVPSPQPPRKGITEHADMLAFPSHLGHIIARHPEMWFPPKSAFI